MNATKQAVRLIWNATNGLGPATYYAEWEGAPKVFSIFTPMGVKGELRQPYHIKCGLPGFRTDLPTFATVEGAKVFCEKMLTRWVAKRGLLFKTNVVITDAMREAARSVCKMAVETEYPGFGGEGLRYLSDDVLTVIIKAALEARG